MNIIDLSTSMSQISTNTDIGTAVLKNSLDLIEVEGASMKKMMEAAATPELGQTIDISL